MALASSFGTRFRDALHLLQESEGGRDVCGREIGERIGEILGEPKSGNAVLEWKKGRALPDVPTIEALAVVLGVTPGWLAFGELTAPASGATPDGKGPTATVRRNAGAPTVVARGRDTISAPERAGADRGHHIKDGRSLMGGTPS